MPDPMMPMRATPSEPPWRRRTLARCRHPSFLSRPQGLERAEFVGDRPRGLGPQDVALFQVVPRRRDGAPEEANPISLSYGCVCVQQRIAAVATVSAAAPHNEPLSMNRLAWSKCRGLRIKIGLT
jgi:hypothetical protein